MNDDEKLSSASKMYDRMVGHLGDFMSKVIDEEGAAPEESLYRELEKLSNRYGERQLIAHGGMKEIYEVEDLTTGRPVAMAIIKNLKSRDLIEQFIQEARITARLEHPNIMPVYDIGIEDSGQAYFTMKLVTADNLGVILKNLRKRNKEYIEKYPLNRLLEIFCDVCDAVAFAHSKGVLHLDLKPDNIQVGDFGEVLVCDWGLSRFKPELVDDLEDSVDYKNGQLTIHGQIFGSPGFMSPEQASVGREELDHYSDIYSLGCLLYAMLTLKPAFNGESVDEILDNTAKGIFTAPDQLNKRREMPEALVAVCLHAMEYEPEKRYGSALDLKREIRSFLNGYATFAERAGAFTQFILFYRRQKALVLVSCLALLFGGVFSLIYQDTEKKMEIAVKNLDRKEQENKQVVQERDETIVDNNKFQELFGIFRKKLDLSSNINIVQGLNNLADRNFEEAAQNFISSEDDSFKEYIELCQKIGNKYHDKALPRDLLYDLVSLLNKDLYTALIQRLLMSEKKYLTDDELEPLMQDLLNMMNPQCAPVKFVLEVSDRVKMSLNNIVKLQNISPLVLMNAHEIDLSYTAVADLSPLAEMPLLQTLNIRGTAVLDLSVLKGLPLESLDLSYTRVKDFEVLQYLPLLQIKLAGVKFKYEKYLKGLKKLSFIFVSSSDKLPENLPETCALIKED